jgi:hypothetical protein
LNIAVFAVQVTIVNHHEPNRMSIASPFWLLFLIPWAALVYWLLAGQRHRVAVPFLELWGNAASPQKIKRTIQPPPVAIACALIALLLSILGAASPIVRTRGAGLQAILIVDRSSLMAAHPLPEIHFADVMMVPPWPGLLSDGSNWQSAPPSAIKTGDLVRAAMAQAMIDTPLPVAVLSDQDIPTENSRVIQIARAEPIQNVDIVHLAASSQPHAQLMVRIRNQSSLKSAELVVTTNGQSITHPIDLPAQDGEQNYFIDLPALGDTVEAKLNAADDLPADNVAWLVRQRSWPKLEVKSSLSPELRRMVEVYQQRRSASDQSRRVMISNVLGHDEVGVVLREGTAKPPSGGANVLVADHPVVGGVDWKAVVNDAQLAEPPGGDWKPLVQWGSSTLVAIREQPVRQVWVGFTSSTFPTSKDFVIFWTNVFDWLGQGGDEFVSEPVQLIGDEWKLQTPALPGFDLSPGIYMRSDGVMRALDATDIRLNPPPQSDWQTRLNAKSITKTAGLDLRPLFLLLALSLVLASAAFWKPLAA